MSLGRSARVRSSGKRLPGLLLLIIGSLALLLYSPAEPRIVRTARVESGSIPASKPETSLIATETEPSSGCGMPPPLAAGTSGAGFLTSNGVRRSYWLHLPLHYQPTRPYPLVLNFHGYASTAQIQELYTGFSRLADARGFIVVYPQGATGPGGRTGWASGAPDRPDTNDVLFVTDLLDRLQAELCINLQRIYATGFSNGGGMTALLACRMATRIAAFASVSGSYYPVVSACNPGRAVPVLEIHGTRDRTVPYDGEPAMHELPVLDWLQGWVKQDGCQPQPQQFFSSGAVTGLEWTGCQDGAVVIHYRLNGGIHAWPGGVTRTPLPSVDQTLDASELIWEFFTMHSLVRDSQAQEPPSGTGRVPLLFR